MKRAPSAALATNWDPELVKAAKIREIDPEDIYSLAGLGLSRLQVVYLLGDIAGIGSMALVEEILAYGHERFIRAVIRATTASAQRGNERALLFLENATVLRPTEFEALPEEVKKAIQQQRCSD